MERYRVLFFIFFINVVLINLTIAQDNIFIMPKGFEDIKMDMSLSEFVETGRKAEPFLNLDELENKIDVNKKEQLVIEELLNHNLFTVAMYWFKDNSLKTFAVLGEWNIPKFYNKRKELIIFSYRNWGAEFYKKVVNINADKGKYVSPLMLWNKGHVKGSVTCIPGKDLNLKKATLQLNIFMQDNLDISSYFQEIKDYKEINKIFKEVGVLTVGVDSTEVRNENDDNSNIIGNVKKDENLIMIDSNNGWSKVIYSNGDEGWINDTFLE